jgi:hypothetical protein
MPIETLGATSESTIARPIAPVHARHHQRPTSADEGDAAVPTDKVTVSGDARARHGAEATDGAPEADAAEEAAGTTRPGPEPKDPTDRSKVKDGTGKLTPEQQDQVVRLQQRDTEVRAHEAAHQAVAGSLGGGVSFTYQLGPDGRQYAVGGEVPIEIGGGKTPQEMLSRARQVKAAALAPANPSSQDIRVAASAAALETKALAELQSQRVEQATSKNKPKEHEAQDPQAKEPTEPKRPEAGGSADGPRSVPDAQRPPEPPPVDDPSPTPAPDGAKGPQAVDARPGAETPPPSSSSEDPGVDARTGPVDGSRIVIDDARGSDAPSSAAASGVTNGWSSASKAFDALVAADATESLHSSGNCLHCSPHLVLPRA